MVAPAHLRAFVRARRIANQLTLAGAIAAGALWSQSAMGVFATQGDPVVSAKGLFGYLELPMNGENPIRHWPRVLRRYEDERADERRGCAGAHCHLSQWLAALEPLRGKPLEVQLGAVNNLINRARYIDDVTNYGVADYWATPGEFFHRNGDCEDFAIAKYLSLRELGLPADGMRLVVATDTTTNQAHVILVVASSRRRAEAWSLTTSLRE